jgi:hypothetical protein
MRVHKITNVSVVFMALELNDFDGGISNSRAIGRGPENQDFFQQMPHSTPHIPAPLLLPAVS